MKVVAIIPSYNEATKIGRVVREVSKYVGEVVVIEDGSTDKTLGVVRHLTSDIRHLKLLRHPVNLGQGAALQTGFEYAKEVGADIAVTFDADGQFSARDIPRLVQPIKEGKADVVLGSRFLGKSPNIPLTRWLVLRLGILFTSVFSNIRLSDTHNGFRAFSKKALFKMDIRHNRWAHPSDIIYQISRNRFRVVEVPVTVRYTKYSLAKGQSNFEALRIPFELVLRALVAR